MNFVTASIGTFSLPFSNNCFENVADDASCYRSTLILMVILNETKQKLMKLQRLRQIARVVVSNDNRKLGTPDSRDGKGDSHADHDFSLVLKIKCAEFHQDRNVGQHRVLQLVHFFLFFQMSKTTASMFTTTVEIYISIRRTVCAPVKQHRILQLV